MNTQIIFFFHLLFKVFLHIQKVKKFIHQPFTCFEVLFVCSALTDGRHKLWQTFSPRFRLKGNEISTANIKTFNLSLFVFQRKCTCQRKKKRCYCFRPNRNENWLFSRYSTGWKCGLHADWTELTGCVDQELDKNEGETAKRRYFYITLLRSPIPRYLSEFRHVQRGATWKNSRHFCLGRQATTEELPPCYSGL